MTIVKSQENLYQEKKKEPKQPKGHLHYWFRSETFINENNERRMFKSECVFKCFFFKQ
jgi:hypothetical protein